MKTLLAGAIREMEGHICLYLLETSLGSASKYGLCIPVAYDTVNRAICFGFLELTLM